MRLDFGSLWGHYGLRTASEMKSDLRFEFSVPKYIVMSILILMNFWASGTIMASKQPWRSNMRSNL